ncbi:hypothetical protein AHAS_Ahas11G0134500 [Arachis hypogaea]
MVWRNVVIIDKSTRTSGQSFPTFSHFQKSNLYTWVTEEVKNTPSTISQDCLDKLKASGVIFTSNDVGNHYLLTLPNQGEHLCHINHHARNVPD